MENVVKFLKDSIRYLFLSRFRIALVRDLIYLDRERNLKILKNDYIRLSTLELISYEIYFHNVPGNVAEVGVYKGDFAKVISYCFPDRKLYLFDTFEGFPKSHTEIDRGRGFSTATQDFSNVDIEEVLKKLYNKENVIIKKGIFPETAKDVDDTFCFVSLDVDLYKPTLDGLEFFYPRLVRGGYIMIHDFQNSGYKGVREAVIEFCRKNNVPFVPLTDVCGSVIIAK